MRGWIKIQTSDRDTLPPDRVGEWMRRHGLSGACVSAWEWNRACYPSRLRPLDPSGDLRPLRDAIRRTGGEFHATLPLFHDPHRFEIEPRWRPVDTRGRVMRMTGWYRPLSPAHADLRAALIDEAIEAVRVLEPDGIVLDFCRWPLFWEVARGFGEGRRAPASDYSRACLEAFTGERCTNLQALRSRLVDLDDDLSRRFRVWRRSVIHALVAAIRQEVKCRVTAMIIPPLAGEDLEQSADLVGTGVTDNEWKRSGVTPSMMLYHEAIGRGVEWVERCAVKIRRLKTPVIPSLQITPVRRGICFTPSQMEKALTRVAAQGFETVSLFSAKGLRDHPAAREIGEVLRRCFGP